MPRTLAFVVLLLTTHISGAETQLTGWVLTLDHAPVQGANIIVKGTPSGTATNMFGEFRLLVPDGPVVLLFSLLGQRPVEHALTIRSGFQYQVNVRLASKSQTFNKSSAETAELPVATPQVHGRVHDRNNLPLAGVRVSQDRSAFVAVTDMQGNFVIPVPEGVNILKLELRGFQDLRQSLEAAKETQIGMQVTMASNQEPRGSGKSIATTTSSTVDP